MEKGAPPTTTMDGWMDCRAGGTARRPRADRSSARPNERTNERTGMVDDAARADARDEAREDRSARDDGERVNGARGSEASDGASASGAAGGSGARDFRARYDAVREDACVVSSVEVRGNERTRNSLVERELRRVYEARTLEGIKDALFAANAALQEYGIFKDVSMVIDADAAGGRVGENDVPGAKVVVNVEEKDMFHFKAGTFMSRRGEGEVEVSMGLRNVFGYADQFEVEAIRGASLSSTYSALWRQPKLYGSDVNLDVRAFQALECFKKLSSFDVTSRGISVGLTGDGPGMLDYTIAWRDVQDPTRAASRGVRRQLGHSLKSALTHTYVADHLDRPVRPMTGYLWKIRSELAGIGLMNDPMATKFAKSEVTAHVVETLDADRGVTASLSGRLGFLMPWGSSDKEGELQTCIADRFFLGGVGCLRQFENNGVGPSDSRRSASKSEKAPADEEPPLKRDALGGDFVWSATAAVQMDVPGEKFEAMREAGIHFHAFASAGALLPIGAVPSAPRDLAKAMRDSARVSLGVGVVWPLPIGQIEINYGKVVRAGAHDRVKDGFQVGIAAHVSM